LHAGLAFIILGAAVEHFGGTALATRWSRWGERLVVIYGACAILDTVILLVAGRYRDIPNLDFLVPAFGLIFYGLMRLRLGWADAFAVGGLFVRRLPGQGFDLSRTFTLWLWGSVLMAPLSEAVALARGTDFVHAHPTLATQVPYLLRSLVDNHQMLEWSAVLILLSVPFAAEWYLSAKKPSSESTE
jgi:hypothetical protein